MNSQQINQNPGRIILFAVALLQTVTVLSLLLFSGSETFEADTGVAWAELVQAYPTVAIQFEMAQQASLVANLAIGLFSLLIVYFAIRQGQRWAWYAMWILPVSMVPGTISLLRTENQASVAVFGGVFILIAVIGLLLLYPTVFGQKHRLPSEEEMTALYRKSES